MTLERNAELFGNVLHERAAARNVHDLSTATNAENGQIGAVGELDEPKFDFVSCRQNRAAGTRTLLAITRRVDVGAPCYQQTVKLPEKRIDIGKRRMKRQQHGNAARQRHCAQVLVANAENAFGHLEGGRYADQRLHHD